MCKHDQRNLKATDNHCLSGMDVRRLDTGLAETEGPAGADPFAYYEGIRSIRLRNFGFFTPDSATAQRISQAAVELHRNWSSGQSARTEQISLAEANGKGELKTNDTQVPASLRNDAIAIVEDLTRRLNEDLPGEELYIGQIELRMVENDRVIGGNVHIDEGDYFTMTMELLPSAPTTRAYEIIDDKLVTLETPVGRQIVVGGGMRAVSLNLDGAIHSGPPGVIAARATLVAHIASKSGGFNYDRPLGNEELIAKVNQLLKDSPSA
jgi:hypothetical protein